MPAAASFGPQAERASWRPQGREAPPRPRPPRGVPVPPAQQVHGEASGVGERLLADLVLRPPGSARRGGGGGEAAAELVRARTQRSAVEKETAALDLEVARRGCELQAVRDQLGEAVRARLGEEGAAFRAQ